jgi:hypothetical protein
MKPNARDTDAAADSGNLEIRRGAFSDTELGLLQKHLPFYLSLHRGERRPTTEAQARFVRVCRGTAVALSEHELVFAKYLRTLDPTSNVGLPSTPTYDTKYVPTMHGEWDYYEFQKCK